MIVDVDRKGNIGCQVTSSTHERKSRTNLIVKGRKYYLKHNSFTDDMPVVVVFKAMGVHTDQEIIQLVGSKEDILSVFAPSLKECANLKIFTQLQALEYIGSKTRINCTWGKPKSKVDKACNVLMGVVVVLAHVPVQNYNFRMRCVYLALMVRRVMQAHQETVRIDDRDYYGNKRLELAGQVNNQLTLVFMCDKLTQSVLFGCDK